MFRPSAHSPVPPPAQAGDPVGRQMRQGE
jgi:hypothetical protein